MTNKESKEPPKNELDEIPEGGLGDIMFKIGGLIKIYTRLRIYRLFAAVPHTIAFGFWGHLMGRLVWKMVPQIRKNDIQSLQAMFPEKSYKECRKISLQAWIAMGYGFFHLMMVQMPNWSKENLSKFVTIEGLHHVDDALKKGKGIIIASTHFGLISAMYNALAILGYKTNVIANVRVSGPIVAIKPIPNIQCIPTGSMRGKKSDFRSKLKYVLNKNQILFIFADFSQRKQMGIRFMGRLGHTPAGIPALAKETGAAVIPAFTFPKTWKHLVIRFLPEIEMIDMPTKKEFLGYNMLRLNNMQTWLIRKSPQLYFERVTYDIERTYLRKLKAENLSSKQLVEKMIDLFREVVDTTYEYGRDDNKYFQILDQMEEMVQKVPNDQISSKRYTGTYSVDWKRVRDNFVQTMILIKDLNLDSPLEEVLKYGLQQYVVQPKVGSYKKMR